jgi:hypothetical protein
LHNWYRVGFNRLSHLFSMFQFCYSGLSLGRQISTG